MKVFSYDMVANEEHTISNDSETDCDERRSEKEQDDKTDISGTETMICQNFYRKLWILILLGFLSVLTYSYVSLEESGLENDNISYDIE